jgi:hypothetical protein
MSNIFYPERTSFNMNLYNICLFLYIKIVDDFVSFNKIV